MKDDWTCGHCGGHEIGHGVEVRGVYDGVLYWVCGTCGKATSRNWSGFGRRAQVAAEMVEEHNMGKS